MKKATITITDTMADKNGLPVTKFGTVFSLNPAPLRTFSLLVRDVFDVLHLVRSYIIGFVPANEKSRVDYFSARGDNQFSLSDANFFLEVVIDGMSEIYRVDYTVSDEIK